MGSKFVEIGQAQVEEVLNMKDVMSVLEEAFIEYSRGEAKMPPKIYLDLPQFHGDFRAMPAFVGGYAGLKWVNVHPDNKEKGIPTVMAKIILSRPQTGENLACIDGTKITNYRTGAAGGIAAKYLANKNANTLGLIGLGEQAGTQLLAISEVFDLQEVRVFDIDEDAIHSFRTAFPDFNINRVSLEEAANADIVTTTTPVREPILKKEWIQEGTHINAIGADAEGKEELDPALLTQKNVKVVVDDIEQTTHSGEINVPFSEGVIDESDVYGSLPDIVAGKIPGRKKKDEITIFDSTGLAIQDIATARVIYETVTSA